MSESESRWPKFIQPRNGYRFSQDAVALAAFAEAGPAESVLDLCSGCGVIPILMWQRSPFHYGVGVELDAELAAVARGNLATFQLQDQFRLIQADVKSLRSGDLRSCSSASPDRFDVVTANPPYWPAHLGRLNPNLQRAAARHEISLTLADVVATARRFLRPGGRFYLSHLEMRQHEIREHFARNDLEVLRMRRCSGRICRVLFETHLSQT